MTFAKNKTWAATQVIEDDADAGNIGKIGSSSAIADADTLAVTGHHRTSGTWTGSPFAGSNPLNQGSLLHNLAFTDGTNDTQLFISFAGDLMFFRRKISGVYQPWQELYHTGNTNSALFGSGVTTGVNAVSLSVSGAPERTRYMNTGVASSTAIEFRNDNGLIGSIIKDGAATSFNTSSDPRLKDFKEAPTDELIDTEFNNLFDCFRLFNWKTDPDGDLVWGFDAHECIDKNTNLGSEGEGPRDLNLGEVYDTTPAVFEDQEQPVLYKTGDKIGQPRFKADGSPLTELVTVEVSPAIELKVSPAGVDQSKAVPILLAKSEQQDRVIASLLARLDAAGL